jgi:hypothetical protein
VIVSLRTLPDLVKIWSRFRSLGLLAERHVCLTDSHDGAGAPRTVVMAWRVAGCARRGDADRPGGGPNLKALET